MPFQGLREDSETPTDRSPQENAKRQKKNGIQKTRSKAALTRISHLHSKGGQAKEEEGGQRQVVVPNMALKVFCIGAVHKKNRGIDGGGRGRQDGGQDLPVRKMRKLRDSLIGKRFLKGCL